MTDEQIVKALECCSQSDSACENCPANGICDDDSYCLTGAILDLIKRQQAEIEELKKVGNKIDSLGLVATLIDQRERLARAKYEWERKVRAEAVREFAEKLKEKATSTFYEERKYVDTEDIDELVREMTEKKGGTE